MTYEEWEAQVPDEIRGDPVWSVKAYRLALFLGDIAKADGAKLYKHELTREAGCQIIRATSKTPGNVSEGYSRGTGKSRAIFLEYALGSTRESRDWYYLYRRELGPHVAQHRLEVTAELCRLLLGTIRRERGRKTQRSKDADEVSE